MDKHRFQAEDQFRISLCDVVNISQLRIFQRGKNIVELCTQQCQEVPASRNKDGLKRIIKELIQLLFFVLLLSRGNIGEDV